MGGGAKGVGAFSAAFTGTLTENCIGTRTAGTKNDTHMDAGSTDSGLACSNTVPPFGPAF